MLLSSWSSKSCRANNFKMTFWTTPDLSRGLLTCLLPYSTSVHISTPTLVSFPHFPSFPTFSVVLERHHHGPSCRPSLPSLKHCLLPLQVAKNFSNRYVLSPLIRLAVQSLWVHLTAPRLQVCLSLWATIPCWVFLPGSSHPGLQEPACRCFLWCYLQR